MAILEVKEITKEYDGIKALNRLSFQIQKGTINALIGPNGAGKTTAFNVITGFLNSDGGSVYLNNRDIMGLSPHKIARLGVARTFQNIRLISQISVLENLMLALSSKPSDRLRSAIFRTGIMKAEEKQNETIALQLLERVELSHKREELAQNLSHGQRRLLQFARIMALNPEVYLLDEPMAGLFPGMVSTAKEILKTLKEEGKTILFIEHDMHVVMDIAENVIVLSYGEKIAEGDPSAIQNNDKVIEAYLGKGKLAS